MQSRAGIFWTTAANLADVIVRETDLSFRTAHRAVARLVRNAIQQGIGPDGATAAMLDEAAEETIGRALNLSDEIVLRALDPAGAVQGLVTPGSANPVWVQATIDTAQERQQAHRLWYQEKRDLVDQARATLTTEVNGLVGAEPAS